MPNIERDMQPDMRIYHQKDRREGEPASGDVLIFKGQGFVRPGIGRDLWERYDSIKKLYREADEMARRPISTISFEDPSGNLQQTQNAQLATIVYNEARRIVGQNESPDFTHPFSFTAGNSLGEYSSLIAAGSMTFQTAFQLVIPRSQYMQESQNANPGSLGTPLLSKKEEERERQLIAVGEVAQESGIVPCLYNSTRQIVFGGTYLQLSNAEDLFKEKGMKFTQLHTDGAFHHPELMKNAALKFAPEIDKADIRDAQIPVIANATGRPVQKSADIRRALNDQMINPVRWVQSMEYLVENGFNVKVEIGEKPTFLDMVKEHPLFVTGTAAGTIAIVVGGVVIGHKLHHPDHKRD